MMELITILGSIVQCFQVELLQPQSFEVDPRFILLPRHGVKVRLCRR